MRARPQVLRWLPAMVFLGCSPTSLPVAHVELPAEVQFTDIPIDVRVQSALLVHNTGTASARVQLRVDTPLAALGDATLVPPLSTVEVPLTVAWSTYDSGVRLPFIAEVDGEAVPVTAVVSVNRDLDGDGFLALEAGGDDCDDTDARTYPGSVERCDERDNDCDSALDEAPIDGFSAWLDQDGDGYGAGASTEVCELGPRQSALEGDCDDDDPAISPGEAEIYYDGVDTNCDQLSDYDADQDGTESDQYGGLDCDDGDAAVGPDALETLDLRDEDCDRFVDEDYVLRGAWAFSEVMLQPTSPSGRYLELHNRGGVALDPAGLVLLNGATQRVALPSIEVPPDGRLVVCEDLDPSRNGGNEACDVRAILDGTASLLRRTALLDEIDTQGWPLVDGASYEANATPDANDALDAWCVASATFGDGDRGTPGSGPSCR